MKTKALDWHRQALEISTSLTQYFRRTHQKKALRVTPQAVMEALDDAKVPFVLAGTYGANGYRDQPRATQDVDVLVSAADNSRATRAVVRRYPRLQVVDLAHKTQLIDPAVRYEVVDIVKVPQAKFNLVLRNSVSVDDRYLVPGVELAVVLKAVTMYFAGDRHARRMLAAGDLMNIADHNLKMIDRTKLRRLAEKLYPGGSKRVMKHLADIAAGRMIRYWE